jgi:predicted O-methyltransferase YrrM
MRKEQLLSALAAARLDPLRFRANVKLAKDAVELGAIQKVTELTPLIAYLRRRQLDTVLEIGTEGGGTFHVWCQLAQSDATLVSVDWPNVAVAPLATPNQLQAMGHDGQTVRVIRGDSHAETTLTLVENTLSGPVDLLFLDGDHSYDGVRRDFNLYRPLVRQRGLVVFHDVVAHRPETGCEVERFWLETKLRYWHREFIDPEGDRGFGPWGGIGVIRV